MEMEIFGSTKTVKFYITETIVLAQSMNCVLCDSRHTTSPPNSRVRKYYLFKRNKIFQCRTTVHVVMSFSRSNLMIT